MRHFYLILLLSLILPFGVYGKKNVISKTGPDCAIAFVDGFKMTSESNNLNIKELKYDLTLVSSTDSVSFTSTIVADKAFRPDSVSISGLKAQPVEKIYIEPKGDRWQSRLRFYIPYDEFVKISASSESPLVEWYMSDRKYDFTLNQKQWIKQQDSWQFAIEIITNNQ